MWARELTFQIVDLTDREIKVVTPKHKKNIKITIIHTKPCRLIKIVAVSWKNMKISITL